MAGIAPSVNNIAAPAPTPARLNAPLGQQSAAPGISAPSNPSALSETSEQSGQRQHADNGTSLVSEGAGPNLHPPIPKPVEVTSVPETPVDNRTPAGGTPRPELKLIEESQRATPEAPVILGTGGSDGKSEETSEPVSDAGAPNGIRKPSEGVGNTSAPVTTSTGGSTLPVQSPIGKPASLGTAAIETSAPASSATGASVPEPSAAASSTLDPLDTGSGSSTNGKSTIGPSTTGNKRKAEDDGHSGSPLSAAAAAANGGDTTKSDLEPEKTTDEQKHPAKKPKLMDRVKNKVAEVREKVEKKTTNGGGDSAKGKPGRPKKDKKAPPPVGRTQRKTRSQGPADGST